MAKEIETFIKLQAKGGQANPAPPIGPALGSKGVNIMEFCKRFNADTQDRMGQVLPVIITVYKDKSFNYVIKTPPASIQLMNLAKIKKGSAVAQSGMKVGSVSWDQVKSRLQKIRCLT
jgi:large subunit ribosomal protein L11